MTFLDQKDKEIAKLKERLSELELREGSRRPTSESRKRYYFALSAREVHTIREALRGAKAFWESDFKEHTAKKYRDACESIDEQFHIGIGGNLRCTAEAAARVGDARAALKGKT